MQENRPDSQTLLNQINYESQVENHGRLKIFFGYAAGVGKTYAMLEAAHVAKLRGVDVVLGYIEAHQRPETSALITGLEQLSVKAVNHKGITLNEFDIDAALSRKPKLILVDELAHSNAAGCRHSKRYQDIEELLRNGIDVFTTINVQHIESLNDMVETITGIAVRERIPDNVFDNASLVEFVDIEPQELIERLNSGKIYSEVQAQKALNNFFDIKNITALREIALRRCADRVNKISEKARIAANDEYYTDEHILVCLSSSISNAKIIRAAARMTNAFRGTFTAIFVETSSFESMNDENRNRLRSNIRLAEQLGATVEKVYGDDIAQQIAQFAKISGVSKIVLGRNNAIRRYFWSKPTLTERLTENAPNLDIYIIPDKSKTVYVEKLKKVDDMKFVFSDVIKSILLLFIATIIGIIFQKLNFSEANIITIYILSVLLTSLFTTQRIYSLISSVLSVLTFNFFFTVPVYTLNATAAGYPVTFLIMFISAFITSSLAVKLKQHAKQSAQNAYQTKILFETNQLLQRGRKTEDVIAITANQLKKLLKKDIVFYPVSSGELQTPMIFSAYDSGSEEYINENERAVAMWVLKNNKHAGSTTNTLGSARCLYLAVRVNDSVYGVIGISTQEVPLDSFENNIVLSVLGECALAMENQRVNQEREDAAVLAKNEQLRANLLRAISHDLRTPLTSISGNANILLTSEENIDASTKKRLFTDIYDDSLWLINLVENLLSVTRIEDREMKLKRSSELMEDVITEALKHVNRKKEEHNIIVRSSENFILAKMDARLIVQVIINIVDNAIKYTNPGSQIIISTEKQNNMVIVKISDDGAGILDEEKLKIFDMFYTASTKIVDSRRNMGLGLALCKSIINAHAGEISVYNNEPRGSIFQFTLPAEEVILNE